tara:strand:- start:7942 stop:8544 length:603 start_codon:yes stop_codon:yes gene_type:complete
LAEDTRRSSKLLKKYEISAPMLSYNDYHRTRRIPSTIETLISGMDVALISDAGTPSVSDPGYRLVRECIAHGINVVSIPGASASLSALVTSGLPTDRFIFEGFLPKKKGRSKRLKTLFDEERSIIIFESPERLLRSLKDCYEHLGDRPVVICRELTKVHEEVWRGKLSESVKEFSSRKARGEVTIIVGKDSEKIHFDSGS